jgi:hypothetical protein
MRQAKRIPIVLEKIPWKVFLSDMTELKNNSKVLDAIVLNVTRHLDVIKKKWKEVPDWRLGQLLINEGIVPDYTKLFYTEEDDWLIQHGYCRVEDIKFWGNSYDKEGNRLSETRWVLLKDLDDAHIAAIIDFFDDRGLTINEQYKQYFEERLSRVAK